MYRFAASVVVFLAAACPAAAEDGPPPAPPAVGGIQITGSFRARLYDWDWFQGDNANHSYLYSGNLLRVGISQSLESLDWQLEFSAPFLLGLPNNAVAAGAQGQLGLGAAYYVANHSQYAGMVFAKQGFVRFKNLGGDSGQSLRIGRFEFLDGSEVTPRDATLTAVKRDRVVQRLIGNFGWSDVQRSFDGVQYLNTKGSGTFTFVGAIPTRGVFQTDGWGENDVAFGYTAYTRQWTRGKYASETRALGIYYHDWRSVLKADNRPLAARKTDFDNIRIFTFGGHHLSALKTGAGTLDFLAWAVGQTGDWGRLQQRAYAVVVEGGIQPAILPAVKPWFRGGYTTGSGDGNANDNRHGTFFQLLPTPRPFARFPFFNMMNNRDIMGSMTLRPHKDVTISSEFHALSLANASDLWYTGGGAYQPWTFGYTGRATGGAKSLANLYDTSFEYRIRPFVTATAYVGYADGRAVMKAIYPSGKNGALGYLELNYKF
jgi:Alginate export